MKKKGYLFINRPLIPGFRATTYFKAFILNSIATALIAIVAVEAKVLLDRHTEINEPSKVAIAFIAAFIAAFITYCCLYCLFHFGGGMLAT